MTPATKIPLRWVGSLVVVFFLAEAPPDASAAPMAAGTQAERDFGTKAGDKAKPGRKRGRPAARPSRERGSGSALRGKGRQASPSRKPPPRRKASPPRKTPSRRKVSPPKKTPSRRKASPPKKTASRREASPPKRTPPRRRALSPKGTPRETPRRNVGRRDTSTDERRRSVVTRRPSRSYTERERVAPRTRYRRPEPPAERSRRAIDRPPPPETRGSADARRPRLGSRASKQDPPGSRSLTARSRDLGDTPTLTERQRRRVEARSRFRPGSLTSLHRERPSTPTTPETPGPEGEDRAAGPSTSPDGEFPTTAAEDENRRRRGRHSRRGFKHCFQDIHGVWYGCRSHFPFYHAYCYWPSYQTYRPLCYRGCYGYCNHGPSYATSFYDDSPSYADTSYFLVPYESAPCPANLGDAWSFLAEGQVDEAYDAFDCLREALPEDGLPRVGFAISAALVAEHEAAVEAMRDALRVDPESLHYVPGDERLQVQFREMADLYQYQARRAYGDVDALFMVAVLSYLLDEPTGAHYAIDVGINLGDDDPSAHALRSMIETAMSESD